MSVINQMLRDLDQRDTAPGVRDAFVASGKREAMSAMRKWQALALVSVVGLVAMAGWLLFYQSRVTPTVAASKPAPTAKLPVEPPKVAVAPVEPPKVVAAPVEPPKVVPAPDEPPRVVAAPVEPPKLQAAPVEPPKVVALPVESPKAILAPKPQSMPLKQAKDQPAKRSPEQTSASAKVAGPVRSVTDSSKAQTTSGSMPIQPVVTLQPQPPRVLATPDPATGKDLASKPAASVEPSNSKIAIERSEKAISSSDRAATEYRNAVESFNQGLIDQAMDGYAAVLQLEPRHGAARQALSTLLLRRSRMAEAQNLIKEGLKLSPENASMAMFLARLQVESGDRASALDTLDTALPHARNRPDYHAFVGTLLQLQGRHKEALTHYEISVRLVPNSGPWLTGLAVSLEEEKRLSEAREIYQRALATDNLGPEQRNFVERKLAQFK